LNGAGLTSVRYAPPCLHRKPQLCGPFLAILFSELILAPLEFRKFPTCNLDDWIALDVLKQSNICEMCGNEFDATRQLVNGRFHYRRTGVLGLEKNSQGAVPVALVLQQLDANLTTAGQNAVFAPSYDLVPHAGVNLPKCEVDFVMILPRGFPDKAEVILGECKEEGGRIDADDIANLRRDCWCAPGKPL
jgi:hypothetical protein